MSKKSVQSRNRLILLFIILLIAVLLLQLKDNERSFNPDLFSFNTDDVTSLEIKATSSGNEPYKLFKEADNWLIRSNDRTFDADNDMIVNMLEELNGMKAIQQVANNKDRWGEYDVTDSTGVMVKVSGDKKELGSLYIGRFAYNQATRKPKTYVRLSGEKEVYAVEGYQSMTFARGLDGLRNKSVFIGNQNDLTQISFYYPEDSSFTLVKDSLGWRMDGEIADSTSMSNYLGTIAYLTGTQFRDDIQPDVLTSAPLKVVLEGRNMSSVEIKALPDDAGGVAVWSSENPITVFDGAGGDLFDKLFVGSDQFKKQSDFD